MTPAVGTQEDGSPGTTPQPSTGHVRWTTARQLLAPSRLDIVVKYLYFRTLATGQRDAAVDALYDQHIARRTGGLEDRKRTLADYHASAQDLLSSLRQRGFDPTDAVPIGANGLPWNGAHRIAACMALNLPIAVRDTPDPAPTWDFGWFRDRGFAQDSLDRILRTYARLSPCVAAFVLWGPSLAHWPQMAARIHQSGGVVGWRDLQLEPDDIRAFVRDLYARRLGPLPNERIEAKARALASGHPAVRVLLLDAGRTGAGADIERWATELKGELRALAGGGRHDYFSTVHATDSADEARYVADLAFNDNSLRQLATRRGREDRPAFLDWLGQYHDTLLRRGISIDDACVVGSAVLEAVGVRQSTDIDCIITTAVRATRFHAGVVALDEDVDLVTAGYHRRSDAGPVVNDSDLVEDPTRHFLFRGLKFANPELVIDRKRQHGRPKDLVDVALWTERQATRGRPRLARRAVVWSGAISHIDATRLQCEVVRLATPGPSPLTHVIAMPPSVDRLPECVLTDPDPLATLERVAVAAPELHAAETAAAGAPSDAGHAFRRLRGFSWVARWLEGWLTALRPDAMVISPADHRSTTLVAAAVARSLGIRVVGDHTALETVLTETLEGTPHDHSPTRRSDAATVCRQANEPTDLLQIATTNIDAVDHARALKAELAGLTAWRVTLEEQLTEARAALTLLGASGEGRAVWLWGAGSAGQMALDWLRQLRVPIDGVIDGDAAKHGQLLGNLTIAHPGILADTRRMPTLPVVLVASIHGAAICDALTIAGVAAKDQVLLPASVAAGARPRAPETSCSADQS